MRIYYHRSSYISHHGSGGEYVNRLRALGHEVLCEPEDLSVAEAVILHEEPLLLPGLFARYPQLHSKRCIGFCVWENEELPEQFLEPLQLLDAVWTPSHFSRKAFLPHFPLTKVLPHIVTLPAVQPDDLEFARPAVRLHEPGFRFFSIVDSINPRKNLPALLTAFAAARDSSRSPIWLVLKQYRVSFNLGDIPGIISIEGDLTPGQMGALHQLCDAYVSAHHAEGWGLGLSEAMAWGKPVIATGYSGNMDFMDSSNSLPIPYTLVPVSELMCERQPLFHEGMHWAEISMDALIRAMAQVVAGRIPEDLTKRAAAITQRFGPRKVGALMEKLLRLR